MSENESERNIFDDVITNIDEADSSWDEEPFKTVLDILTHLIKYAEIDDVRYCKRPKKYLQAIDDLCRYYNDKHGFTFDRTGYFLRIIR